MSHGVRRCRAALIAAVGVCAVVAMGCSGDAERQADDTESVDEVASSWGEIDPRDEERTRTYLAGAGAPLMAYAGFAASLDDRLDDAAYGASCADLQTEWDASFARRQLIDWLNTLPDPILGRLLTSQIPVVEKALQACADGNQNQGAEAAEQVTRLQELIDRRLDQLGVDR